MTLRWKKHPLACLDPRCGQRSFTLGDHRIERGGVHADHAEPAVAVERGRAGRPDMQPEAFAFVGCPRHDGAAYVRQVCPLLLFHAVLAAGEGEEGCDEGFLLPVRGEEMLSGGSPEVGSGWVGRVRTGPGLTAALRGHGLLERGRQGHAVGGSLDLARFGDSAAIGRGAVT